MTYNIQIAKEMRNSLRKAITFVGGLRYRYLMFRHFRLSRNPRMVVKAGKQSCKQFLAIGIMGDKLDFFYDFRAISRLSFL